MTENTFQHDKFYKITGYGRENLNFLHGNGRLPVITSGKGKRLWFVGLAWKKGEFNMPNKSFLFLIASNWYEHKPGRPGARVIHHDQSQLHKRDRVKRIESFSLKQFPLLIGTKTTTLYAQLLKNRNHLSKNLIERI